MTRKGQPKVRTGCLTCKSRKVKCDEAKPACLRCTSTGRKCDGYAVVVPSNRALARARSRATKLNAALAQASAAWEGDMDEEKIMEHFRRKIAPMIPGHLEGNLWTDIIPRMSRTEPAFREAMAAISTLMPGMPDNASDDGNAPGVPEPYTRLLGILGGNTRKQKPGVDTQAMSGQSRAPFNLAGIVDSPASSSSTSLPSTGRLSNTPLPDGNRAETSSTSFTPPQPYNDEGESDPKENSEVNVTLCGCLLFMSVDFLREGLGAAMEQLATGIEVLNNVDYSELSRMTIEDVLPKFYRLSIIQMCFYDRPCFPNLNLNHGPASRYNLGPFDKSFSIYRPQSAMDTIILDAIRYIRSAGPESWTDSRLRGPVMSDEQTAMCNAFDKWHAAFTAFIREPRLGSDQPLPPHAEIICMETEMKYWVAKMCISVCRFSDESAYDSFKTHFRRITSLAQEILTRCPELPPDSSLYSFNFEMSYLPLMEFVISKCRWLDIRYQAWLIVCELATGRREPVTLGNLHLVGQRMIEQEHNVKIQEVNRENAPLFSLPAEEMRVKDYSTDQRFADLAGPVDGDNSTTVQVPYTQRLMLRCGSYELDELARWVSRGAPSQ
ncbi:hypothetical protein K4K53_010348 [Colletotrichum sp. SAR 10_77]|nr:hypothetical protein K4K53_010348 [Colletotrichum sp. SAR 10_77]